MSFWSWAGAIAAGWFTASILFAALWAAVGKRVRPRPKPPADRSNVHPLQPPRILRDPEEIAAQLDRDFGPKAGS